MEDFDIEIQDIGTQFVNYGFEASVLHHATGWATHSFETHPTTQRSKNYVSRNPAALPNVAYVSVVDNECQFINVEGLNRSKPLARLHFLHKYSRENSITRFVSKDHQHIQLLSKEVLSSKSNNYYLINAFQEEEKEETYNSIDHESLYLDSNLFNDLQSLNRFNILVKAFIDEWKNYHNYLPVSERHAVSSIFDTIKYLVKLEFEDGAIEFLKDDGVKFTLVFPDERTLMINKTLIEKDDLKENEIVFSYFIKRKFIASYPVDTEYFVSTFNDFLLKNIKE